MKLLRSIPAIAVAVVVLQACAPAQVLREDGHPAPSSFSILSTCNSTPGSENTTDCTITVDVADDPHDTSKCTITLSGDKDLITFKNARGSKIVWKIASASGNYVFTRDGIAFIDNFRPRMFRDAERSANGEEFAWTINRSERRVNAYVISIRTRNGVTPARECEKDPWIRSRT